MTVTPLRTERLLLRQWREDDRVPFAAMNSDAEVMRHFPAPLDRAASDAFLDRMNAGIATDGWGLWAVEVVDSGEFVGFTGLSVPSFDHAVVEVGWRYVRSAWGRGYATEAARAALEVAFGRMRLAQVVSFTAAGNLRSQRVMQRLGMTRDPADDFDHPALSADSPLRRHVLYRLAAP